MTHVTKEVAQVIAQGARADILNYALAVQDPFVINWHHELIADRLMQMYQGLGTKKGLKRLMIAMPPQIANKSTMVTQLFPSWVLGKRPNTRILSGSYNTDQANLQSEIAMNHARSEVYEEIFGTTVNPRKRATGLWGVKGGGAGYYQTFGMNSGTSGKPADLILVDDPIRGVNDANSDRIRDQVWRVFSSDLQDRMLPEIGAMIVVFTRWHLDDPIGREIERLKELGRELTDEWEVLHLPAIAEKDMEFTLSDGRKVGYKKGESLWESRFPVDPDLINRKEKMSAMDWAARYQQNPISSDTQVFNKDLFKYITEEEVEKRRCSRVLMVDSSTGMGTDYTGFADVRVDLETKKWYVKAWHERLKSNELMDKIINLNKMYRYNITGIEDGLQAKTLIPIFQQRLATGADFIIFPLIPVKSGNRDKKSRIVNTLEPKYRQNEIFHIEGECGTLEEELELFGSFKNEDVADALSYVHDLLQEVSTQGGNEINIVTPNVPNYE